MQRMIDLQVAAELPLLEIKIPLIGTGRCTYAYAALVFFRLNLNRKLNRCSLYLNQSSLYSVSTSTLQEK